MVRISNSRSKSSKQPPRSGRAARKFDTKRRGILRAAAAAFRENGFHATGMREIAQAADLSPANLYYYFPSKDQILYYCQDLALDRMLEAFDAVQAAGGTVAERLRGLIEAQLGCMLDELDGAAAHLAVDALPAKERKAIVAKRDRYERAVRSLVEEGLASGELAPCDPVLVTRAILGALNWTVQWFKPGGATTSAAVASEYARFLVRGLET